eukprot:4888347-Amphidinium_carterae.2
MGSFEGAFPYDLANFQGLNIDDITRTIYAPAVPEDDINKSCVQTKLRFEPKPLPNYFKALKIDNNNHQAVEKTKPRPTKQN